MKTKTNKVSATDVFISLSGKSYKNKSDYLETKLKREKSKFSLGYRVFENALKSNSKRITIVIKDSIDKLNPKKESPKVFYLADNLITNRKKGYLGLLPKGEGFKIENPVRKIFPKGDKSNGEVEGIYKFDLVKV